VCDLIENGATAFFVEHGILAASKNLARERDTPKRQHYFL
jgi:hypothetical protein